jgi:hypothetical protein
MATRKPIIFEHENIVPEEMDKRLVEMPRQAEILQNRGT